MSASRRKAANVSGQEDDVPNTQPRAPRPSKGKGKAAAASIPVQAGALPPEPQAAANALQAASASAASAASAAAAPAGAAAAAAVTEDDEPGVLPTDLLAVSRKTVKRMCRSLEIADVNFGVYDKSQARTQ